MDSVFRVEAAEQAVDLLDVFGVGRIPGQVAVREPARVPVDGGISKRSASSIASMLGLYPGSDGVAFATM